MNEPRICRRCGGRHFRYDPRQMAEVCVLCRTPVDTAQRAQLDRSLALAQEHLRVGNWSEAASTLTSLTSQTPGDVRLYYGLLRAYTHDFSDVELSSGRVAAADAWDKLVRLGSLSPEMAQYKRRYLETHKKEFLKQRRKIRSFALLVGVVTPLGGFFYLSDSSTITLLYLACIVTCVWWLVKSKPFDLLGQIKALEQAAADPRRNPFVV